MVGNRSAVGEQYVDLQPKTDNGPLPRRRTPRSRSRTPAPRSPPTSCWRTSPPRSRRSTTTTCGRSSRRWASPSTAPGEDLGQIIDTSNSFIETANANFDTTTGLIKDSNTVLQDASSTRRRRSASFTNDLALFSTTLAGADPDLRNVIDSGSVAVNELRTFIEENEVDLAS